MDYHIEYEKIRVLTHKLGKSYYYFLTAYYRFPKLIADEFMEILLISMKFGKRESKRQTMII